MDLSKLTPLVEEGFEFWKPADRGHTITLEMSTADWEFCCLARQAFDVMMRRGWSAHKSDQGWWVDAEDTGNGGYESDDWNPSPFEQWMDEKYWPDPFTALVAADAWYKEHVEAR